MLVHSKIEATAITQNCFVHLDDFKTVSTKTFNFYLWSDDSSNETENQILKNRIVQIDAKHSNFEIFENALYIKSKSMPLTLYEMV